MLRRSLIGLVAALVFSATLSAQAPSASAQINVATLDTSGWTSHSGRFALLSGVIVCTPGEAYGVTLSLAHQTTGVQAHGATQGTCNGDLQRWTVRAAPSDLAATLAAGDARVCWNAATWSGAFTATQERTERFQQCTTVTLTDPLAHIPTDTATTDSDDAGSVATPSTGDTPDGTAEPTPES